MPLIPTPVLSNQLSEEINRAEMMHGFILANSIDSFTADTDEIVLVAALYSIVEEHHAAILYLLRAGQFDGSAFALARPLVDAAYRAHWVYACAKPDAIQRIRKGEDCYPGLINMAEGIDKKLSSNGLFSSIAPYIRSLHEFTHGGLEQLIRRFDENGNVRPTYSDLDKQLLLNSTTAHVVALTIAWCQLASKIGSATETHSVLISGKYSELYKST